jgi:hypothetical protein
MGPRESSKLNEELGPEAGRYQLGPESLMNREFPRCLAGLR